MNRSIALVAAAPLATALGLAAVMTPTAAQAAVTIDCGAGPVSITESTEDYVLTGSCTDVEVDASNVTISLERASRLHITGANVDVASSGPIESLTLTEAVSSVEAPRADTARVASSNVALRIDKIGALTIVGHNNSVRAVKGRTAKVKGANNRLTYTRLAELSIKGDNNRARVREGRTSVSVRGANNIVRVHRRAGSGA